MICSELRKLAHDAIIYITHLKPEQINEVSECAGDLKPEMLQNNQVFKF